MDPSQILGVLSAPVGAPGPSGESAASSTSSPSYDQYGRLPGPGPMEPLRCVFDSTFICGCFGCFGSPPSIQFNPI